MKKIKLYIIVGFLGSGKTTLLKNLLQMYKHQKVGVIVNDFGQDNVDSKLISSEISSLKEVSDGSMFCSCKSDMFVKMVVELSHEDLDIIFAEASGMANPGVLLNIIDLIVAQSNDVIEYRGTIGVVDATNIHKLIQVANMVKNQIVYSDLLLLNKIDLVNSDTLLTQIEVIKEYNKDAMVLHTSYAAINKEHIDNLQFDRKERQKHTGIDLNMHKVTIDLSEIPYIVVEELIHQVSEQADRIKGFVQIDGKMNYIEYINQEIFVQEYPYETNSFLVFLSIKKEDIADVVLGKLKEITEKNS